MGTASITKILLAVLSSFERGTQLQPNQPMSSARACHAATKTYSCKAKLVLSTVHEPTERCKVKTALPRRIHLQWSLAGQLCPWALAHTAALGARPV